MAAWEESRLICPGCSAKIERIQEPLCKKCGKPLDDEKRELCTDCKKKKHEFEQGKAVFVYSGGIRESLYRFKYSNRREYADFYGEEALRRYEKWILNKKIQVIIPIPLHKKRQRVQSGGAVCPGDRGETGDPGMRRSDDTGEKYSPAKGTK